MLRRTFLVSTALGIMTPWTKLLGSKIPGAVDPLSLEEVFFTDGKEVYFQVTSTNGYVILTRPESCSVSYDSAGNRIALEFEVHFPIMRNSVFPSLEVFSDSGNHLESCPFSYPVEMLAEDTLTCFYKLEVNGLPHITRRKERLW